MNQVFSSVVLVGVALALAGIGEAQTVQDCINAQGAYSSEISGFDLTRILPPKPDTSALAVDGELVQLHSIQRTRSDDEIKQANADANNLNMFAFQTVLGDWFNDNSLPATKQLSLHVCAISTAIAGNLKKSFNRPRPYDQDPTIKPVCPHEKLGSSYPSGHSITGYLEALTLAEIVPDRRSAIIARAGVYARNRMVCGVHYLSDIVAGQVFAYALFDQLKADPAYQKDLDAAKTELRANIK